MIDVDQVVLGAGVFGMYGCQLAKITACGWRSSPLTLLRVARATFGNQARLHLGYHYPRSVTTALQSAAYYARFSSEFEACLNATFAAGYAVARFDSYTSSSAFEPGAHRDARPLPRRWPLMPGGLAIPPYPARLDTLPITEVIFRASS